MFGLLQAQLGDKWPQLVSVITAMVQASDHHPVVGAVAALASWVAMGVAVDFLGDGLQNSHQHGMLQK